MVYMSEMALPQFRGTLLSSFSLSMTLGQLFLAIGLKILSDTAPLAYRNMFYAETVFLGLWMIPLLLLPESPGRTHPFLFFFQFLTFVLLVLLVMHG